MRDAQLNPDEQCVCGAWFMHTDNGIGECDQCYLDSEGDIRQQEDEEDHAAQDFIRLHGGRPFGRQI